MLPATRSKAAIDRIADFKPDVLDTPIELELTLKHYRPVELLSYLPNVERINAHTIRYSAGNMIEISWFLEFVLDYKVDMQP